MFSEELGRIVPFTLAAVLSMWASSFAFSFGPFKGGMKEGLF